jgi:hypothetical protein
MKGLMILTLMLGGFFSGGCMSLLASAMGGAGGQQISILNVTSVRLCSVAIKTDLDSDIGPEFNRLVEKINGVLPGGKGHIDVPVYSSSYQPKSFSLFAYACRDSSGMGASSLIAQTENFDIGTTSEIVIK